MRCIVSIVVWVVQEMSRLRQILDTPEFRDGNPGLKLNLLNWTGGFEYLTLKRWASTLPLVHEYPWSGFVNFWKLNSPSTTVCQPIPIKYLM